MKKKFNLNLLRRHLKFCKKRYVRFGEGESDIVEENKKKIEQIKRENEEKAKLAAEEKVRQEKKERNKKRWQLAGKIALGAAAVGGAALFATKTQAGRNMTSSVKNSALTAVGQNPLQREARAAREAQYNAANAPFKAANENFNASVQAPREANAKNGVYLNDKQAKNLVSQTLSAEQKRIQDEQKRVQDQQKRDEELEAARKKSNEEL